MLFIGMAIILFFCGWEFSKLRKQNEKIIKQNYLILNLLGEIKNKNKQ
ncbi:hypothetical protein [Alkalihalobacterium sp. APHAB7]